MATIGLELLAAAAADLPFADMLVTNALLFTMGGHGELESRAGWGA
jgi:hypothetical protein